MVSLNISLNSYANHITSHIIHSPYHNFGLSFEFLRDGPSDCLEDVSIKGEYFSPVLLHEKLPFDKFAGSETCGNA